MQEFDYLIIGAGAVGLAFADMIVQESDATVAIVDRNARNLAVIGTDRL